MSKSSEENYQDKYTPLSLLKLLQVIWAAAFLIYAYIWVHTPNKYSVTFAVIALLYSLATVGIFWDIRLAWIFSVVPPLLIFLLVGAWVSLNFFMFFIGHELYKDSPATIIVVIIYCLFTIVPSGIILLLFWINRNHLLKVFRYSKISTGRQK